MRSAAGHQHTLKLHHKRQHHDSHVQMQAVYIIISLTCIAKRIGESTAGNSHDGIFEEVVYD